MNNKATKMLRKQAKLSGLPVRKLKRLWSSGAVSDKEKVKWRKIVEQQVKESDSGSEVQEHSATKGMATKHP